MAGCCSLSKEEKQKNQAAKLWLRDWTTEYAWKETRAWKMVNKPQVAAAEGLLRDVSFVKLTDKQADELLGAGIRPPLDADQSYVEVQLYLLRGVGDARERFPLEISTSTKADGNIWVGGGAINSTCDEPMERRPVVVWLPKAPNIVYVTFSTAR